MSYLTQNQINTIEHFNEWFAKEGEMMLLTEELEKLGKEKQPQKRPSKSPCRKRKRERTMDPPPGFVHEVESEMKKLAI